MPIDFLNWLTIFICFGIVFVVIVTLIWMIAAMDVERESRPAGGQPQRATTTRDDEGGRANGSITETTPLLQGRVIDDEEATAGGSSAAASAVDEEQPAIANANPPTNLGASGQPPFFKFLLYHRILLGFAIPLPFLLISVLLIATLGSPLGYRLPYALLISSTPVFFVSVFTIAWSVSNLVRHRRRPGTFLPLGVGVLVHGIAAAWMCFIALGSSDLSSTCSPWSHDGEACLAWARKFHILVWAYLAALHAFWYVARLPLTLLAICLFQCILADKRSFLLSRITHGILFVGCLVATYKSRSLRADSGYGEGTVTTLIRRFMEILPARPAARSGWTLPDGPLRVEFTLTIQRQDSHLPTAGESPESSGSQVRNGESSTISGVFNINGGVP